MSATSSGKAEVRKVVFDYCNMGHLLVVETDDAVFVEDKMTGKVTRWPVKTSTLLKLLQDSGKFELSDHVQCWL